MRSRKNNGATRNKRNEQVWNENAVETGARNDLSTVERRRRTFARETGPRSLPVSFRHSG